MSCIYLKRALSVVRGFLDSGYKVSKWIVSPHHDIAIEHGPEKHPFFFWWIMIQHDEGPNTLCLNMFDNYCYGSWSLVDIRQDWTVSTDTHTHTCLSLLQGTLERRLNRTVSVNICQMSIFPLPLQLKGANLPHIFFSRHGGFELARCRFSSKCTSLLSRKAVAQQHVTNFEPVTCFEGARKQGGMCSKHLKSSSWLFSVSVEQHSEQACSLEVQRLTAKWWSCVVHCSTWIIP